MNSFDDKNKNKKFTFDCDGDLSSYGKKVPFFQIRTEKMIYDNYEANRTDGGRIKKYTTLYNVSKLYSERTNDAARIVDNFISEEGSLVGAYFPVKIYPEYRNLIQTHRYYVIKNPNADYSDSCDGKNGLFHSPIQAKKEYCMITDNDGESCNSVCNQYCKVCVQEILAKRGNNDGNAIGLEFYRLNNAYLTDFEKTMLACETVDDIEKIFHRSEKYSYTGYRYFDL